MAIPPCFCIKYAALDPQLHRWIGIAVVLQLIAWTVGGLYFSIIPIETIRGEHLVQAPPPLNGEMLAAVVPPSSLEGLNRLGSILAPTLIAREGSVFYRAETETGTLLSMRVRERGRLRSRRTPSPRQPRPSISGPGRSTSRGRGPRRRRGGHRSPPDRRGASPGSWHSWSSPPTGLAGRCHTQATPALIRPWLSTGGWRSRYETRSRRRPQPLARAEEERHEQ